MSRSQLTLAEELKGSCFSKLEEDARIGGRARSDYYVSILTGNWISSILPV